MLTALFYCERVESGEVVLNADESRHARASRRLRPGDVVRVFDGAGRVATGVIASARPGIRDERGRVRIILGEIATWPVPRCELTLICAAPKGDRLSWMVEKCTELAVSRIVVARFERSVASPTAAHAAKLRRIALEACKQCGRLRTPTIDVTDESGLAVAQAHVHPPDGSSIRRGVAGPAAWVADPDGEAVDRAAMAAPHTLAIVGPEGGISPAEQAAFDALGVRRVRVAPNILRTETAAMCIAALWGATADVSRVEEERSNAT